MHIVVMMNELPSFAQTLSEDRYVIWKLNPDHTHTEMSQVEIHRRWVAGQLERDEEAEIKRLERKRKLENLRNGYARSDIRNYIAN